MWRLRWSGWATTSGKCTSARVEPALFVYWQLTPDRWGLESHDVVTAVHVEGFAGDAGTGVRGQEHSSSPHFADFDVAQQGGTLGAGFQHVAQSGNAAGRQSLDRPGGDRIYTDLLLAQVIGKVAHGAFEGSLGHAHHVVVR